MEYNRIIKIDVSCTAAADIIEEKQLDNGTRTIEATFYNALTNTDVTFSGEETFEIRVKRADGELVTAAAEYDENEGIIICTLTADMLGVPGRARADIRAIDGTEVLSGGSFFIDVQPLANGEASSGISGDVANVRKMTREEFDELESKPANTLYIVDDSYYPDEKVLSVYLGDIRIATGGSNSTENTNSLYLQRNVAARHQRYARIKADEDWNVLLAREIYEGFDPMKLEYLYLYQDEDEEENITGVAKLSARDKVILESQNGEVSLEVNAEGVFVNGQRIGGGANVGRSVGIYNGLTSSVIGVPEEVT